MASMSLAAQLERQQKITMKIEATVAEFKLGDDTYQHVMELMLKEFKEGLGRHTNANAKVKMFPTYVRSVPDGTEKGNYLALDLGGTNFRVLLIKLEGQNVEMKSKIFLIPPKIMVGKGSQLFDHIANCIHKFMSEENILGQKLFLGFTFSFPLKQEGIDKARLVTWTKGFKASGVEGEDVVQLLHDAIKRRGDIEVECVAVINDTVGTLMSCAHADNNCLVGLILGTGSNACYMERLEHVETWDGERAEPKQVIINTEWGAFGDSGCLEFLRTSYDRQVDETSINPGRQLYEKMMSGMYMGEIVRQVLEKLTSEGLLFGGNSSTRLEKPGEFFTKYVSEIEADDPNGDFANTKQVFDDMMLETFTTDDCRAVQYICSVISTRAAYLAAAGIATILNRINKPQVTVGVDGSLYKFHPHFRELMEKKISELLTNGKKFKLMESSDGSGKGAALVAAVAAKLKYGDNLSQHLAQMHC